MSEAITQHADAIIGRIKELVEFGLLESDATSDLSSDVESLGKPIRPIIRDNYRPPEVATDIDSDQDSTVVQANSTDNKRSHAFRSQPNGRPFWDDDASDSTITPAGSNVYLAQAATRKRQDDIRSPRDCGPRASGSSPQSIPETNFRLWQKCDGTLNLEAQFLEKTTNFVILRDADGQPHFFATKELSPDDLRYLQLVSPEPETTANDGRDCRSGARAPVEATQVQAVASPDPSPTLRGRRTLERQLPPWEYRMDALLPTGYAKGSITSSFLPSAAAKGDTRLVLRGLAAGENIESRGPSSTEDNSQPETTALFRAIEGGHFETAQVLLEHGANPCNVKSTRTTPLCRAAIKGDLELVRLLLEYGARPEMKSWGLEDHSTALHGAADSGHYGMTKLLLEYKADPDIRDGLHVTPLHLASRGGRLSVVQLLLEQGAYPNAVSLEGQTPLYKAASAGDHEIVSLLIRFEADVDLGHGRSGETTLYKVA